VCGQRTKRNWTKTAHHTHARDRTHTRLDFVLFGNVLGSGLSEGGCSRREETKKVIVTILKFKCPSLWLRRYVIMGY